MSLWKRIRNLWKLSGLDDTNDLVFKDFFKSNKEATIVDTDNPLDKIII